jgi:hypothetical protein
LYRPCGLGRLAVNIERRVLYFLYFRHIALLRVHCLAQPVTGSRTESTFSTVHPQILPNRTPYFRTETAPRLNLRRRDEPDHRSEYTVRCPTDSPKSVKSNLPSLGLLRAPRSKALISRLPMRIQPPRSWLGKPKPDRGNTMTALEIRWTETFIGC